MHLEIKFIINNLINLFKQGTNQPYLRDILAEKSRENVTIQHVSATDWTVDTSTCDTDP